MAGALHNSRRAGKGVPPPLILWGPIYTKQGKATGNGQRATSGALTSRKPTVPTVLRAPPAIERVFLQLPGDTWFLSQAPAGHLLNVCYFSSCLRAISPSSVEKQHAVRITHVAHSSSSNKMKHWGFHPVNGPIIASPSTSKQNRNGSRPQLFLPPQPPPIQPAWGQMDKEQHESINEHRKKEIP
ncbi:hypothetical protein BGX38DRAFT_882454 [Terfezia claveryi]|nr:hypothetical protein BGX38DRAFT_882454 [Terfezia claveryi]